MKRFFHRHCRMMLLVLILLIVPAAAAAAQETITYIGSSTVGRFMEDAADIYDDARFRINTRPESGGGEHAVATGAADLGGVAREVKPEILARGVEKYLIGRDGIGVWVHADNPVENLSQDQLRAVFSGEIRNWKAVGGPDIPIRIYIVNPQSATRAVFSDAILGDAFYGGEVTTIRPDPAVIDRVAADPGGIGQLSFALGLTHAKAGSVKPIAVGGNAASVENPDYPITRPLYLITKGEPAEPVKAFIRWTLSDAGQAVVKRYFIGVQ